MNHRTKANNPYMKLLSKIEAVVDSLPSDGERKAIIDGLDKLIDFLSDVKELYSMMPADIVKSDIHVLFGKIKELDDKGNISVINNMLLGVKRSASINRASKLSIVDENKAQMILNEIKELSSERLRDKIIEMDSREIRGIAKILGMKVTSRSTLKQLTEYIIMKITNIRGYKMLGLGSDRS